MTLYSQPFKETDTLPPGVIMSMRGGDVKEASNTVLGSSWRLNKWQQSLLTKSRREKIKAVLSHLYI